VGVSAAPGGEVCAVEAGCLYDYVRRGFALDFWFLLSMGWVETKKFGID